MALKIADDHQRGSSDYYELALLHMALGNRDEAFHLLDKACEDKNPSVVYIKVEPAFDPLRSDPRFQALLRKMDFPEK